MKLNHECVRDLLLYLEDNLNLDEVIDVRSISLKKHNEDDVRYSALKLYEIGFLDAEIMVADGETEVFISSSTWEGQKFLDNVRATIVWQKAKSIAGTLVSVSIGMMENIASQVLTNIISKQLGLPQT